MMIHRKLICSVLTGVCLLVMMPGGILYASSQDDETIIENAMEYLKSYSSGTSRTPLSTIERFVLKSGDNSSLQALLEDGFINLLNDETTTPHALQFIVRQLAVMGSDDCVPALLLHLENPEVADGVIRALETIPAPEADAALRDAAMQLPYPHPAMSGYFQPKLGAIQALARIGDLEAIPILLELAESEEDAVRLNAYEALGRIGGEPACAYLFSKLDQTSEPSDALADSCLLCAEAWLAAGDLESATAMLDSLAARDIADYIKAAAVNVRMNLDGVNQAALALQSGASDVKHVRQLGILWLGRIEGEQISQGIAGALGEVEPEIMQLALNVLAIRADTAASQGVVAMLEADTHPELKSQFIETLAYVGDITALNPLLNIMLEGDGAEARLARESLARIRGVEVNQQLMQMAQGDDRARQLAAIQILGDRRATEAAPLLLELAEGDSEVRNAALRSLQPIAGIEQGIGLLQLVENDKSIADQVEQILVLIIQRHRPAQGTQLLTRAINVTDDVLIKALLLNVLGRVGGDEALNVMSSYLNNADDVLRNRAATVLASWTDSAALPALQRIMLAGSRFEPAVRTAALRGAIRLLRQETTLKPTEKLAYLDQMKELDFSDDDARQLLGIAGTVPLLEMFEWLYENRDATGHTEEHYLALVQVAEEIAGAYPDAVLEALNNIDFSPRAENTRNRANHVKHIIQNSRDYVTAWAMAGPYRENALVGDALFNTSFPPERNSRDVVWKIARIGLQGESPGRIALDLMYPEYEQTAYLRTSILVDKDVDAVLKLNTPNSIRVWLNGDVVHAAWMEQDLLPRIVEAPLSLQAGINEVLLAVCQYNAGWFVDTRLYTPDGDLLTDYTAYVSEG